VPKKFGKKLQENVEFVLNKIGYKFWNLFRVILRKHKVDQVPDNPANVLKSGNYLTMVYKLSLTFNIYYDNIVVYQNVGCVIKASQWYNSIKSRFFKIKK
jgi:hypothetical protein